MASLKAFWDLVFIDRKNGQRTGTTSILYEVAPSSNNAMIWERTVGQPWIRVSLSPPRIVSSPSGNPKRSGVFDQTLKPGQVYQVVMYDYKTVDPNVADPDHSSPEQRPDASVTVVALLKDPEKTNLIVSQDKTVGGTWFRKVVTTTVPTMFILQVDKTPPFTDAQGVARFIAPLATVLHLSNTHHDLQVEPLLPGNDLFYLMRIIDENGNWEIVFDQFRTKKRKVTIDFEVMHIINDGALGDTTAEFRIWVMEGEKAIKSYFFGDVDNFAISDRPDPGEETKEWIPLALQCPTFTLGPKDVTEDTYDMGILTRGLIFRTTGSNEHSRNFHTLGDGFPNPTAYVPALAIFNFPTGGGENVQSVPFVVRTSPEGDVEFEYDVRANFTVQYT